MRPGRLCRNWRDQMSPLGFRGSRCCGAEQGDTLPVARCQTHRPHYSTFSVLGTPFLYLILYFESSSSRRCSWYMLYWPYTATAQFPQTKSRIMRKVPYTENVVYILTSHTSRFYHAPERFCKLLVALVHRALLVAGQISATAGPISVCNRRTFIFPVGLHAFTALVKF